VEPLCGTNNNVNQHLVLNTGQRVLYVGMTIIVKRAATIAMAAEVMN